MQIEKVRNHGSGLYHHASVKLDPSFESKDVLAFVTSLLTMSI